MTEDFHKPFIKSLLIIAIVTVFSIVSSKYIVNYYLKHNVLSSKNIEYSSQKSQDDTKSILIK